MVTRRAGWSRSAQEAYGRRARAARWSRRWGGRANRRPEQRAVCRSCRWAPSSLGQRRADAWQPREGRRRGTPAPSFRHTLVWDSGGFSSNGVREAQRILKTIDTEDMPGGWGDNNGVVRHRHIHDPGIQQEPNGNSQDLCGIYPIVTHYESADDHDVTGYVRGEDAKAQESDQVDHTRDDAEQGREPPFQSRGRRCVMRCDGSIMYGG